MPAGGGLYGWPPTAACGLPPGPLPPGGPADFSFSPEDELSDSSLDGAGDPINVLADLENHRSSWCRRCVN